MKAQVAIAGNALGSLNRLRTPARARKIAWLALFALLTLQLANIQHAAAHTVADLSESCDYCFQFKDGGNALSDFAPAAKLPIASSDSPAQADQVVATRRNLAHRSRAPPQS